MMKSLSFGLSPRWAMPLALLGWVLLDWFGVRGWQWTLHSLGGLRLWVNLSLSVWVAWALLTWFRGRTVWVQRAFLLLVAVSFFVQTAYFSVYEKYIGIFDLRFFLSDPLMSLQLYGENGSIVRPLGVAALGAALAAWALKEPAVRLRSWYSAQALMGGVFFALLTVNWYSAPNLQLAPVSFTSTLTRLLDIRVGKNAANSQQPKVQVPHQALRPNAPDIVWVIGESVNRQHLNLYGYARPTTPFLSSLQAQGQLRAFEDALSVGPRTMVSVPYLLTGLQGIDPNGRIYQTPSVFNYAKAAGYTTALVTSQDFQWRNVDKLFVDSDLDFFRQGSDFSADVNVSVGANDQVMFERGIQRFLQQSNTPGKPRLLVTQLSGSHPPFGKQVPANQKQFLPEESPNSINAYDNTIWYTDLFLQKLVTAVRAQRSNTWVFFTTDHGTNVTGQGNKFHGDLGEPVVRVPMVVIPPTGQLGQLQAGARSTVAHADLLATSLDLMGISPVTPIDGLSLRKPMPENRLRVTTSYVITLHNDPVAALDVAGRERFDVNFDQNSVTNAQGQVMPYSTWNPEYRAVFESKR